MARLLLVCSIMIVSICHVVTDTCPDKTAKDDACEIKTRHNDGKLTLLKAHASGVNDDAFAYNNIVAACDGKKVARSNYTETNAKCPAPGGHVCLYNRILEYVYILATMDNMPKIRVNMAVIGNMGLMAFPASLACALLEHSYHLVNELAGARHSCTSKHYDGYAVDLDDADDKQNELPQQDKTTMVQTCQSMCGWADEESTHIHCQIVPKEYTIKTDAECDTLNGKCQWKPFQKCDSGQFVVGKCSGCGNRTCCVASDTRVPIINIMLLEPTGMRLGGVAKSHGDIDYSLFLGQLKPSKACYVEVALELDLHPAILAAIVSRESNFGYSIQNNGWGYGLRHRRYGLMQCDIVNDPVKIFSQGQYDCQSYSWDSCEHVKMVVRYALIPMITAMNRMFPDWTTAQHIQGGVAAYMLAAGADSVISWDDVDRFTTGHDYSNDVIARAQYIVKKERWDDGSNRNGGDGPVMDDALISRLKTDLINDEGLKYHIYKDSVDKLTFGIGHLIKKTDPEYGKPINTTVSKDRVDEAFEADVTIAISDCVKLHADFDKLPDEAKLVIANMMFNLGYPKLSKFVDFKAAVVKRDWNMAADEMKDSKWYRQVTNRAERLIKRIRAL